MVKTIYYRATALLSCYNWLLIAIGLGSCIFLTCCHQDSKEIRIIFTGDILLSRNVRLEINKRHTTPWINVTSLFKSSDLVIGNLEGAVGVASDSLSSIVHSPVFDVSKSFIPFLHQAGFTAISIENNHSFDMGDSGKVATIHELVNADLRPIYYQNSPQFFKINQTTIALIAINLVMDRKNSRQKIPSLEIKQKLQFAKSLANLVIVTIHWGSELLEWPNTFQREAANWLTSNGADLVIGSHPHVIQQPEMINGKPVFFSLGNHLFDQKYESTKTGLMVDCRIRDGKLTSTGIITHSATHSFYPEIVSYKNYSLPSVDLHEVLHLSDYALSGKSASAINQCKTILVACKQEQEVWETHPMSLTSVTKAQLDGKNDYLIALEKHFSNMDEETNLRPYVYQVNQYGLSSKWRGSSLAWPLLDIAILQEHVPILCALHRGDSFINLNPQTKKIRVSAYKWNGFGFDGVADSTICKACEKLLLEK